VHQLRLAGPIPARGTGRDAPQSFRAALSRGTGDDITFKGAWIVGKYFLAWILGVPVFVLVIIYLIF
jgi:hypothetical protein